MLIVEDSCCVSRMWALTFSVGNWCLLVLIHVLPANFGGFCGFVRYRVSGHLLLSKHREPVALRHEVTRISHRNGYLSWYIS
jgi:hypothetical protein